MPRSGTDTDPHIADEVPWAEMITDYDRAHFVTYLRLLDAKADSASDEDMARIVLGIDPEKEPDRAARALASHLRRARWMTEKGYRHLMTQ
jgi:type VI secretion system activator RovC-like protein